jgi:hypothetical protein
LQAEEHLNYCRGCIEVYNTAAKTLQRRIGEANASTSRKLEPTPIDKEHKSEGEETDNSSTDKSPKNLPHLDDAGSRAKAMKLNRMITRVQVLRRALKYLELKRNKVQIVVRRGKCQKLVIWAVLMLDRLRVNHQTQTQVLKQKIGTALSFDA